MRFRIWRNLKVKVQIRQYLQALSNLRARIRQPGVPNVGRLLRLPNLYFCTLHKNF